MPYESPDKILQNKQNAKEVGAVIGRMFEDRVFQLVDIIRQAGGVRSAKITHHTKYDYLDQDAKWDIVIEPLAGPEFGIQCVSGNAARKVLPRDIPNIYMFHMKPGESDESILKRLFLEIPALIPKKNPGKIKKKALELLAADSIATVLPSATRKSTRFAYLSTAAARY